MGETWLNAEDTNVALDSLRNNPELITTPVDPMQTDYWDPEIFKHHNRLRAEEMEYMSLDDSFDSRDLNPKRLRSEKNDSWRWDSSFFTWNEEEEDDDDEGMNTDDEIEFLSEFRVELDRNSPERERDPSPCLTLRQLSEKITKEDNALHFFKAFGVIACDRQCVHGHYMRIKKNRDFFCWRCTHYACHERATIRADTWLEGSKVPLVKTLLFIYCWTKEYTRMSFCEEELSLVPKEVAMLHESLREVCAHFIQLQRRSPVGGPKTTVEIERCFVRGRRFFRGNLPDQRLLAGICRETEEFFLVPVADWNLEGFVECVLENVKPGSTIVNLSSSLSLNDVTDRLEGYRYLELSVGPDDDLEYVEDRFQTPHFPRVKMSRWRFMKQRLLRDGWAGADAAVAEFIWRELNKGRDLWLEIFKGILNYQIKVIYTMKVEEEVEQSASVADTRQIKDNEGKKGEKLNESEMKKEKSGESEVKDDKNSVESEMEKEGKTVESEVKKEEKSVESRMKKEKKSVESKVKKEEKSFKSEVKKKEKLVENKVKKEEKLVESEMEKEEKSVESEVKTEEKSESEVEKEKSDKSEVKKEEKSDKSEVKEEEKSVESEVKKEWKFAENEVNNEEILESEGKQDEMAESEEKEEKIKSAENEMKKSFKLAEINDKEENNSVENEKDDKTIGSKEERNNQKNEMKKGSECDDKHDVEVNVACEMEVQEPRNEVNKEEQNEEKENLFIDDEEMET